ncbi:MAG: succinate dehydrogenase iron-sulfur subunit [Phycisphaerales bacterium]
MNAPNAAQPVATPAPKPRARSRRITVRIRRQDGPGQVARFDEFSVPVDPGANVISVLLAIAANPTTSSGRTVAPPVWDSGCLEEVCGACTMVINGRVRQSCSCLIDEQCPNDGDTLTLEPMSAFPVVRDLSVDRSRLFHNLQRVKAWVPVDGTYHQGPGPRESSVTQETRYVLSTCMSCGCCLEACPQFNAEPDEKAWDRSFLGAHAISQARLFNMHETSKQAAPERLDVLSAIGGVSDCGNAQNCVKVCPKKIPLTESIAAMGRAVVGHWVKRLFS